MRVHKTACKCTAFFPHTQEKCIFFCIIALFFVLLQRESANNGNWKCHAG